MYYRRLMVVSYLFLCFGVMLCFSFSILVLSHVHIDLERS